MANIRIKPIKNTKKKNEDEIRIKPIVSQETTQSNVTGGFNLPQNIKNNIATAQQLVQQRAAEQAQRDAESKRIVSLPFKSDSIVAIDKDRERMQKDADIILKNNQKFATLANQVNLKDKKGGTLPQLKYNEARKPLSLGEQIYYGLKNDGGILSAPINAAENLHKFDQEVNDEIAGVGWNVSKAIGELGEETWDAYTQFATSNANPYYWFNQDKLKSHQDIADELANADATQKAIETYGLKGVQDYINENSDLFNEDSIGGNVVREVTKMGVEALLMPQVFAATPGTKLLSKAGAKQFGRAALGLAGTMGITAYGSAVEQAYRNGATREQATKYGLMNSALEVATEMMFAGLGGFKGKGALDDVVQSKIASKYGNKLKGKILSKVADVLGEETEELVSWGIDPLLQKMTYAADQELGDLYDVNELGDTFTQTALSVLLLGCLPSNAEDSRKKIRKQYVDYYMESHEGATKKEANEALKRLEKEAKKVSKQVEKAEKQQKGLFKNINEEVSSKGSSDATLSLEEIIRNVDPEKAREIEEMKEQKETETTEEKPTEESKAKTSLTELIEESEQKTDTENKQEAEQPKKDFNEQVKDIAKQYNVDAKTLKSSGIKDIDKIETVAKALSKQNYNTTVKELAKKYGVGVSVLKSTRITDAKELENVAKTLSTKDETKAEKTKELPKKETKTVKVEKPKAETKVAKTEEKLPKATKEKREQFEIIQKNNPMQDEYHTGIRSVNDIKTLSETLNDSDYEGYTEFNPDLTRQNIENAIKKGTITVYSSYPIENGAFISPSKMEAQSYSADGKVYSKEVNINDVAWIDPTQGQYAKVEKPVKQNKTKEVKATKKLPKKEQSVSKKDFADKLTALMDVQKAMDEDSGKTTVKAPKLETKKVEKTESVKSTQTKKDEFDKSTLKTNGKLKEMYHASDYDNVVFDKNMKAKRYTDFGDYDVDVKGFYFSDDPEFVKKYGQKVKSYYLNVTKPLNMDNIDDLNTIFKPMLDDMLENQDIYKWQYDKIIEDGTLYKKFIDKNGIDWEDIDKDAFNKSIEIMKKLGYDGFEVNEGDGNKSMFVFEPNQIMSVEDYNKMDSAAAEKQVKTEDKKLPKTTKSLPKTEEQIDAEIKELAQKGVTTTKADVKTTQMFMESKAKKLERQLSDLRLRNNKSETEAYITNTINQYDKLLADGGKKIQAYEEFKAKYQPQVEAKKVIKDLGEKVTIAAASSKSPTLVIKDVDKALNKKSQTKNLDKPLNIADVASNVNLYGSDIAVDEPVSTPKNSEILVEHGKLPNKKTEVDKDVKLQLKAQLINQQAAIEKMDRKNRNYEGEQALAQYRVSPSEGATQVTSAQTNLNADVVGKSILQIRQETYDGLNKDAKQIYEIMANLKRDVGFQEHADKYNEYKEYADNIFPEYSLEQKKEMLKTLQNAYPALNELQEQAFEDIRKYYRNENTNLVESGYYNKTTNVSVEYARNEIGMTREEIDTNRNKDGSVKVPTVDFYAAMNPYYFHVSRLVDRPSGGVSTTKTSVSVKGPQGLKKDANRYAIQPMFDGMADGAIKNRVMMRENQLLATIAKNDKSFENNQVPPTDIIKEDEYGNTRVIKAGKNEYYIRYREDGKYKAAKINKSMYDAISNNTTFVDEVFKNTTAGKLVKATNKLEKQLLTTLNPEFVIKNTARDLGEALLNTNYNDAVFTAEYLKSVWDIASNNDLWQKFKNAGLFQSDGYYVYSAKKGFEKQNAVVRNTIGRMEDVAAWSEALPRFTEFKLALRKGESLSEAIRQAKRVTVDFSRRGKAIGVMDRNFSKFVGAAEAGMNTMYDNIISNNIYSAQTIMRKLRGEELTSRDIQTLKKSGRTIARIAMSSMIPSLYNSLAFGGDDDKEWLENNVPEYIRNNAYIIRIGKSDVYIPLYYARSQSVYKKAVDEMVNKDSLGDKVSEISKSFADNIAPNNPIETSSVYEIFNWFQNKDYYGNKIYEDDDTLLEKMRKVGLKEAKSYGGLVYDAYDWATSSEKGSPSKMPIVNTLVKDANTLSGVKQQSYNYSTKFWDKQEEYESSKDEKKNIIAKSMYADYKEYIKPIKEEIKIAKETGASDKELKKLYAKQRDTYRSILEDGDDVYSYTGGYYYKGKNYKYTVNKKTGKVSYRKQK